MHEKEIRAVDVARRLGVGLDYVYGLLWTGKLAGRKVNGTWGVLERSVVERIQKLEARDGN